MNTDNKQLKLSIKNSRYSSDHGGGDAYAPAVPNH